jgi:iron-sulfur cluster assembly accessory protein
MPTTDKLFTLTPAAIAYYQKKMTDKRTCLRFFTKSGCADKKLEIEFVAKEKISGCEVLSQDDVEVFYNKEDADFLKGLIIDYVKNITGGKIELMNPNAVNMCGCGSSWSTEKK